MDMEYGYQTPLILREEEKKESSSSIIIIIIIQTIQEDIHRPKQKANQSNPITEYQSCAVCVQEELRNTRSGRDNSSLLVVYSET
jgi:hypothetical protein